MPHLITARGISEIQHIEIPGSRIVFLDTTFTEVHIYETLISVVPDLFDISDIPIADIFMVLDLHHLVAHTEFFHSVRCLGFALSGRIHLFP